MEDIPPPVDHVLRPHHIAVLAILMMAFKDMEIKKFPGPFALNIHRVLLNEISEVALPRTHDELLSDICSGPGGDVEECHEFKIAIRSIQEDIDKVDKMANFLGNLPCLFMSKNAEDSPRFTRRSVFGFFCRRCYLTFTKLSFPGLSRLCQDYKAWCAGDSSAGYGFIRKEELYSDLLLFKTQADRRNWADPKHYEAWQKSQAIGDENLASDNVRKYFEQHFHDGHNSGFRQHSLLNLARMHYVEGEYTAVRKLLDEAISAARVNGDSVTLHLCTSILHRLPSEFRGQKPVLHDIQPDVHPLEVLFDVSKLLDEENDQPLNAAFVKIFQSVGIYDHLTDFQLSYPGDEQQWSQHAVQSIVWREAGCDKLAEVEESLVLAFTETGGESNTRLAIVLNKSFKEARQGNYNKALIMLIDPSVWRGLIIHDYSIWANQVWHILVLRATRHGQLRLHRELLLPRKSNGTFNEKEYLFNAQGGPMSNIRESLYQILQLRQVDQATFGIDYLLRALWHSEFLCKFNMYRTAIIVLADVGLELGMPARSRQILDEILPQVINGDDLEQRGAACFTLARCIIVAKQSSHAALQEALPYLSMAESDFKRLEMYRTLMDVQYMLSVVYHNLGMIDEKQKAAQRHFDTEMIQQKLEMETSNEEILRILDLLATIGDALAAR